MEVYWHPAWFLVFGLLSSIGPADCKAKFDVTERARMKEEKSFSILFNSINLQWTKGKLVVSTKRKVRLLSAKTGRYLEVKGRVIEANGRDNSYFAKLVVESVGYSLVRIRGAEANRYICFNDDSRLVAKRYADDLNCVFREQIDSLTLRTFFTSYKNKNWFINVRGNGRTKAGERLKVSSTSHRTSHFIEREWVT